ncbi:ferredoxin [Amycolatopsis sp. NPDC006131]|uniref:ferredoxin n=1 Tax=Amycolatopsis sp. NPDC006131 TaxID=3156731 RepID=UPI0033B1831C
MKVTVDKGRCEAHGQCVMAAEGVFALGDDDEVVTVLDETPGEDRRAEVEHAAALCPVAAIKAGD